MTFLLFLAYSAEFFVQIAKFPFNVASCWLG